MKGIEWDVGEELVKEGTVARLEIHAVDERVDAQSDRPTEARDLLHRPDSGIDGGNLVLELPAYLFGSKAKGGDHVGERFGPFKNP